LDAIKVGRFLPSLEVCRVGGDAWVAAKAVSGFAEVLPSLADAIRSTPSGQAHVGWPPVGHLTVLCGAAVLGAVASVAGGNVGFGVLATMVIVVYADAWIAGVRQRPDDKSLANMSPMGWALAVLIGCGLALPVYALVRGKRKSRPGSGFLAGIVYVGALAPVGLVVALALWIGLPTSFPQTSTPQVIPYSDAPPSNTIPAVPTPRSAATNGEAEEESVERVRVALEDWRSGAVLDTSDLTPNERENLKGAMHEQVASWRQQFAGVKYWRMAEADTACRAFAGGGTGFLLSGRDAPTRRSAARSLRCVPLQGAQSGRVNPVCCPDQDLALVLDEGMVP
jgi:hypothetical protein